MPSRLRVFFMRLLGLHVLKCGWCKCFVHWSQAKDSTGICDQCAMEFMAAYREWGEGAA